jgi:hypothetical protein
LIRDRYYRLFYGAPKICNLPVVGGGKSAMRKFVVLAAAIVTLNFMLANPASTASIADLRSKIEGSYALQKWYIGEKALTLPQVDGRFVLQNGSVITILLNNANEASKTSSAQFGVFTLGPTSFSYRYDSRSSFRQTPSGILPGPPGFEGMRTFAVSTDESAVHLNSGQQEFTFTADGMTYSEEGKVLRVWRRIKSE